MLKHYQLLFADNHKYRHKFYLSRNNSAVCRVLGQLKQLRIRRVHITLPAIYLTECSKATAVIFLLCILLLSPTFSLSPSIAFSLHPFLVVLGVESNTSNIIMHPINICFISEGHQVIPWTPHT